MLRTSTSGFFFTAISKWAIEHGGVVFGAAFGGRYGIEAFLC